MKKSRIKELRLERGLSLEQLGKMVGTTKQTIHRYETGEIDNIPREKIERLAECLGAHPSHLMGWDSSYSANSSYNNILPLHAKRLPVLGNIACGEPIYKPGDGSEYATIEESVVCDFALIAQGDSMIGDRIHSGDVVFIRKQDSVRDGEIAAIALDDELTLKRVRRIMGPGGRVAFTQLLPSNPAYDPIEIGGEEETRCVNILGKAVAVRFMR